MSSAFQDCCKNIRGCHLLVSNPSIQNLRQLAKHLLCVSSQLVGSGRVDANCAVEFNVVLCISCHCQSLVTLWQGTSSDDNASAANNRTSPIKSRKHRKAKDMSSQNTTYLTPASCALSIISLKSVGCRFRPRYSP